MSRAANRRGTARAIPCPQQMPLYVHQPRPNEERRMSLRAMLNLFWYNMNFQETWENFSSNFPGNPLCSMILSIRRFQEEIFIIRLKN